ncbi:MAG: Gfo/Idh/MocA family oxidoreductase [Deltaproteobacteria bacterium]|jgi:predicted dehydrogenase|nr:Gfo/Idh/MocA family oxidoreductase [Deltaproteobacteria bacterium]
MTEPIPVAVVGSGYYGSRHVAKYRALPGARLVAVVDVDPARARAALGDHPAEILTDPRQLAGKVRAASVAVPTTAHRDVVVGLLEAGIDVLVEKPIATTVREAQDMVAVATRRGCVLQVGHLERFNPVIQAVEGQITRPLFAEVQRMGPYTQRASDVDVVLDLMIHDLDLLLHWMDEPVRFVHAVGVAVVTSNVDIANARIEFEGGCVANVTASRVSVDRTRKVRLFQPSGYWSLDLDRKSASGFRHTPAADGGTQSTIEPAFVEIVDSDALASEIASFLERVRDRARPVVSGDDGRRALGLAHQILASMAEHRDRVASRLGRGGIGS